MDGSKLIFGLDRHEDGTMTTVAFSRERSGSSRDLRPEASLALELGLGLEQGHRPKAFHLPLSPSSPGSLSDLSSTGFFTPAAGLVKSSSIELEPKGELDSRPKPLVSLVKSLSTEISRRGEPDVYLSRSDSKLHMPSTCQTQPWKLRTQQGRYQEAAFRVGAAGKESRDVGSVSPGSLSPTESRGSSLIAELEDTRRKFSEAMQEPLSMWNKIMGDESLKQGRAGGEQGTGSPKQGRAVGEQCMGSPKQGRAGGEPSPLLGGSGWGVGSMSNNENGSSDSQGPIYRRRTTDREQRVIGCESPNARRPCKKSQGSFDICEEMIKAMEGGPHSRHGPQGLGGLRGASVPAGWLFLVGLLTYGFLVLPLPSYVTGLSLGLAGGFMLGLLVVLVLAPRRPSWTPLRDPRSRAGTRVPESPRSLSSDLLSGEKHRESEVLEGWMNEMFSYDPETYHPLLTHSVFASLEGSRLRLAYPRTNIPRRATFEEPTPEPTFVRYRTYQLDNCKVSLLPPVLARKRVWNQKYPICIILAEGEMGEESLVERLEDEDDKMTERQTTTDPRRTDSPVTLYLFGRTGREKEEWFQHFLSASMPEFKSCPSREGPMTESLSRGDSISGSVEDLAPAFSTRDLAVGLKERVLLDYGSFMSQLIGSESGSPALSPSHSNTGSPTPRRRLPSEEAFTGGSSLEGQPAWLNSLVGRIFWDVLREKYWADLLAHKIQKKLSKIRLPYFMNELTLADLDMGTSIPQVLSNCKPSLDRRGLWLELEVTYTGCLQMTLETKMNLCKLGRESGTEMDCSIPPRHLEGSKPRLGVLADSDEESSSAGSSDEEDAPPTEPLGILGDKGPPPGADGHGGSTGKKILRFVDKIAKSKYFQKATENEFIKKKIAEVSNMPLMLTVEVLELTGTLTVNIPPPPTDRIWYSFRLPPRLDLRVCPMLGEREVTFTHVTEWIEKKLQCEFEKVLVMPNMDDLYLPLMTSGLDNPPPSNQSPARSSRRSSAESHEFISE